MRSKTTVLQRLMAMALAVVITFGLLPAGVIPAKADTGYQLPQHGWEGFIELYREKTYIKRSDTGELYNDRSINGHPLRMYKFRGSNELNDRYNLNQAMYCIQYGVNLPNTGLYIAKNPKILNDMGWSQAVQEGIMLSLGFGYPNTTINQINKYLRAQGMAAITDGDAFAATQVLVWECQQGLRNFNSSTAVGKNPNLKMYRNYIEDTPAEGAYWYILDLIRSYIGNEKYQFSNLTKNARYMVWASGTDSTKQMMMGFHFTDEPSPPDYETGKIEVYKKDPDGKPLAGAMFAAWNETNDKIYFIGPTDKNGYAISDELPLGTYTVTETVFPEGYEPSEAEKKNYQWVVTVDGNQNNIITIDVENYQHGIITINKTVTGGTAADKAGWMFDIYDSNWKYVETVTTDQSGTAITSRLLAGKYYVVEAGNTDPEKWNGKYWELDINSKTGGSLNLLRNASLTSEALGYNYGWYGGDNTKLAYVTFDGQKCLYMADPTTNTSEQNIASFRQPRIRLSAGTYTFSGKVYVEEERPVRISIYDNSTGKFKRIDSAYSFTAKAGWNDFSFTFQTIYNDDENEILRDLTMAYVAVEVYDSIESGVYLAQPKLEPGTEATEWTDSYRGTEVTLTKDGTSANVHNSKNIQLKIQKAVPDMERKDGWIFDVYDEKFQYVETIQTDASGVAISSYLPYGDYYVLEKGHIDASILSKGEWLLDVTGEFAGTVNLLRNAALKLAKDLPYSQPWYGGDDTFIQFVKNDAFDCIYLEDPSDHRNEDGIASIRQDGLRLYPGTYTFSGKILAEGDREVRIVIYDDSSGAFIQDTVIQCSTEWKEFSLTFELDELLENACVSIEVHEDNPHGIYLTQPKLEPGDKATEWTDTYIGHLIKGEDPKDIEIENDKPVGKIEVQKETSDGKNLGGWLFEIRDSNGNLITTLETDPFTGKAETGWLPTGKYTIIEIGNSRFTQEELKSWSMDVTAVRDSEGNYVGSEIDVESENVTTYRCKNIHYGKIIVNKQYTNTDETDKSGWLFEIYKINADGTETLIETLKTDRDGFAESIPLEDGQYRIKEIGREGMDPERLKEWILDITAKRDSDGNYNGTEVEIAGSYTYVCNNSKNVYGRITIQKATNTNKDLAGWQFGIYNKSTDALVETITTDSAGIATSKELPAGTYYIKEIGHVDGYSLKNPWWTFDSSSPEIEVTANFKGETFGFNNINNGFVVVHKEVNEGDTTGWVFRLTNQADPSIVYEATTFSFQTLMDANVDLFTAIVQYYWGDPDLDLDGDVDMFDHQIYVIIELLGDVNNDGEVDFMDASFLRGVQSGSITDYSFTKAIALFPNVTPGVYDLEEFVGTHDEYYWKLVEKQAITVKPNDYYKYSIHNFANTYCGRIQIRKTTSTGIDLSNWQFGVYYDKACTQPVLLEDGLPMKILTDRNGLGTSEKLLPGTYYIKEIAPEGLDPTFWKIDDSVKEVTVTAGSTADLTGDPFKNEHYGNIKIYKETMDGSDPRGWTFRVFDAHGNYKDYTITELENGYGVIATDNLAPGTYTVMELIPEGSDYICVSPNPQTVTVVAGKTGTVTFINKLAPGSLNIKKSTTDGIDLIGWMFQITDKNSNEVIGTFTTDENGNINVELEPGTYIIEEIIPEGSLYYCASTNPQEVQIQPNQTTTVSFHNALKPGSITIIKQDEHGTKLAGAHFLLEWSEDGQTWQPVFYNTGEVVKGGCSSEGLTNGILITGSDGTIVFSNLHPLLQYRVTETQAPDKYRPVDVVYTGTLPQDTLSVEKIVLNYRLPGFLSVQKTTNTGATLEGWIFTIYDEFGEIAGYMTTDHNGYAKSEELPEGTYTIRETGHTSDMYLDNPWWICDTTVYTSTVVSDETTAPIIVENINTGFLLVKKSVNAGSPAGWKFTLTNQDDPAITYSGVTITLDSIENAADVMDRLILGLTDLDNDGVTNMNDFRLKAIIETLGDFDEDGAITEADADFLRKVLNGELEYHFTQAVVAFPHVIPGKYTLTETGSNEGKYWDMMKETEITVSAGEYGKYTVTEAENILYGRIKIYKSSTTGIDLSGWQFGIYLDEACTQLVYLTDKTDANGMVETTNLLPGIYYIKELPPGGLDAEYWVIDSSVKQVEVVGEETTDLAGDPFVNEHYGKVTIYKTTSDGNNLIGWTFEIYDANGEYVGTYTIEEIQDGKGVITTGKLAPGTYTIVEIIPEGSDYECSDPDRTVTVTVTAGNSAEVSFHNVLLPGKVLIYKQTNTGLNLHGWRFGIYRDEACTDFVAEITTNEYGTALSGELPPGVYFIKEIVPEGSVSEFWIVDTSVKRVEIKANRTTDLASDPFVNNHLGKFSIFKTTSDGLNLKGWTFKVYKGTVISDKTLIGTFTTNDKGEITTGLLDPGTYTVLEIVPEDSDYMCSGDNPKTVEVKAGTVASVSFHNILKFGSLEIEKTTEDGKNLGGWEFKITNKDTGVVIGTFKSGSDGKLLVENLLPGTYIVEEIIPEGSPYYCDSQNPQEVVIRPNAKSSVAFHNALHEGRIRILKVDATGKALAGAKFKLEWSSNGQIWKPVCFSETGYDIGGCTSPNLTADGTLTSNDDGLVTFTGLYPTLQYRLSEVQAPDGYVLLTDYAYIGTLPNDTFTLERTVVNHHGYRLPNTGSELLEWIVPGGAMLIVLAMSVLSLYAMPNFDRKKKRH